MPAERPESSPRCSKAVDNCRWPLQNAFAQKLEPTQRCMPWMWMTFGRLCASWGGKPDVPGVTSRAARPPACEKSELPRAGVATACFARLLHVALKGVNGLASRSLPRYRRKGLLRQADTAPHRTSKGGQNEGCVVGILHRANRCIL